MVMESLSAHEACDKAVTLVALQGRSGCKLSDVWVWLGIVEDEMKAAVHKMISKRLVTSRREDGEEYVVAEECDRLRSLGLGRRTIVTDAMDMEILEEIGRRGPEGCELSSIQAELKKRVRGSSDESGGGKKRRNLSSQHSEPLAVDRLVQLGLVTKTLRTRTVYNGKRASRLTANVLRLSRFGPLVAGADERGDDQQPPWKRALMSALESRMKNGEPELTFLSLPPAARGLERRWPFAELWKNMKDDGTLARIASLIDGPTPAVSTMKASAACDLCRKISAAFAASPLDFFMADLVRPDSKRGEGREMWCVGIKAPSSADQQRLSRSGASGSSSSPQWYGPAGFLRGMYDKIRCAGAVGGRTNTLTRDLGHGTSKLVEKGVATLVRAEMIQLRRVTEGRSHSYLALTPQACEIYTMWEQASTTMAAKKDVVDIAEALVKPERTVTSLDLKEPSKGAAVAAVPTTTTNATENAGDKQKTEDEDKTRTSFVPGKPIQHAHTAERKQRAAFIVATISKHRIVDKGALLLALYRVGDQSNSKRRVDAKTWKRLIQQLVETGELGEARVEMPAEDSNAQGGDVVVVLHATDVAMPGPESVEFVTRRVAMIRDEERRAAENEAERRHRNLKRSGGDQSSSQALVAVKRPRLAKKWDHERRRRSRERFLRVSATARRELAEYLAKVAEKQRAAKRARIAEDSGVPVPRRRKRTATTTRRADGGRRPSSSSIGVLRPHKKAPPQVVGGMHVAPLARTMARAVVEARRRRVPCALSQILDASVPRPSRDAACSRLLRRGWVKHAGGEDDETMLELPYQAILDAGTNELRRAVGDVAFFAAARKRQDSYDLSDSSSLVGGTLASLLSAHALGAVSLAHRDDRVVVSRRLRREDHEDDLRCQLWRAALGDTLHDVPWYSPESGKCLDERLRAALRRAVFVASLLKGGHLFFTCRALVEAQHKSTVPELDELEMASLLFDLCDAGVLRVDRPPPLHKRNAKPTIFDDDQASSSPTPAPPDQQQQHSLALSGLTDPTPGPSSPRFCVTPQAIAKFVALEAADAQGPID